MSNMVFGKYVITADENREIIEDGGVVYEDDLILDVGKKNDLEREYEIDRTYGGKEKIVIPGLINTHGHLQMSVGRGFSDGLDLMGLKKLLTTIDEHTSQELARLACLISLIELLKNGVTTTLDIDPNRKIGAEAIAEIESRGVVAEAMKDRVLGEKEGEVMSTEEAIEKGEKLVKKYHTAEEGRLKAWFGPYTELLATPELLERSSALAEEYDTGIHIHLAETFETQTIIKREYGKRIFEYARDTGLLGPNVLAAHCCWLDDREIRTISEEGVKISHCPVAEMKLSDGITPVKNLLSQNVNVSISSDAPVANNGFDLINDAKVGALLQRIQYPYEPSAVTAHEAFRMITIEAAKSLLWEDEIGSLEKGKKADIVVLDIEKPYYFPVISNPRRNIIQNLIFSGSGRDVKTVIVNGKTVVKNREMQTVDEEKIRRKAQERTTDMYESIVKDPNPL